MRTLIYPPRSASRMRELASREYAPTLAYASAILFLLQLVVGAALAGVAIAAALNVLFAAVLALLVVRVDAPPWARLAGYAWAGLAGLGALLVILAETLGGSYSMATGIGTLALLVGAAWVAGASLADPGAGRSLGIAAAAGMALSGILRLADTMILVDSPLIVRLVSNLTLALLVAWFVVLARDLQAGQRHWGGHRVAM